MINEKILRKILLICILVAIMYPIFNIFVTLPFFKKQIIRYTEEDAIVLTYYLNDHVKKQNESIIINNDLKNTITNIIDKLHLYNIKLFKSDGEVVFSLDTKDIGKVNQKPYFHQIVAKGKPYSSLVKKNKKDAHGNKIGIDIVETYVPIFNKHNKFIGAFEIYYIVTDRLNRINRAIILFSLIPTVLVVIYIVVLILSFKRIKHDMEIKNQIFIKLKKSQHDLKAANKTKNKLFSLISHDLRSPFSAILAISDLLVLETKNCCNKELPKLSVTLNDSALKLKYMIENLFQWASVQIENIQYNPIDLDLKVIINDTIELLESNALLKNIEIKTIFPSNEEFMIKADDQMISTILRNFITNALKFTPQNGTITINLEWSNNSYHISVKDSGVGIEEKRVHTLLNENITESTYGTNGEKGSGLGLSLCKNFIEKHKGQFWIESEKGKGSTFHFSLPK